MDHIDESVKKIDGLLRVDGSLFFCAVDCKCFRSYQSNFCIVEQIKCTRVITLTSYAFYMRYNIISVITGTTMK